MKRKVIEEWKRAARRWRMRKPSEGKGGEKDEIKNAVTETEGKRETREQAELKEGGKKRVGGK